LVRLIEAGANSNKLMRLSRTMPRSERAFSGIKLQM
jgi:hypothetical protein